MKNEIFNAIEPYAGRLPGKSRRKARRGQTQNHHRLLGDGDPMRGPLPAASGLSLVGFLFPLLQPMLRVSGRKSQWARVLC